MSCGVGYKNGSVGCASCDVGYFADIDGTCTACPPATSLLDIVIPVVRLLGVIAAAGVGTMVLVTVIMKTVRGSVLAGLRRTVHFIFKLVGALQVLAQVGRSAVAGLPPLLRESYTALSVFVLERISVSPACFSSDRFLTHRVQLGIVAAMVVALVLLQINYRAWCGCMWCGLGSQRPQRPTLEARVGRWVDQVKSRLRRVLFAVLCLLYATVMTAVGTLLQCDRTLVTVQHYLTLEGDGSAVGALGAPLDLSALRVCAADAATMCSPTQQRLLSRQLTVSVMASDPYVVCYEGSHRTLALFAWVVAIVYVIGFPALSFLVVSRRLNHIISNGATGAEWSKIVSTTHAASSGKSALSGLHNLWGTRWIFVSCCSKDAATRRRLATYVNNSPGVRADQSLLYFTAGDIKPSMFWMMHADLALLLVLSVLVSSWRSPQNLAQLIGKLVVTVGALWTAAALYVRAQPYTSDAQYVLPVTVFSLLLASFAAWLNFVAAMADTGGSPVWESMIVPLSFALFSLSLVLIVILLVSFLRTLVNGARQDSAQGLLGRMARRPASRAARTCAPILSAVELTRNPMLEAPSRAPAVQNAARDTLGSHATYRAVHITSATAKAASQGAHAKRKVARVSETRADTVTPTTGAISSFSVRHLAMGRDAAEEATHMESSARKTAPSVVRRV
jgi:hypothetical protein